MIRIPPNGFGGMAQQSPAGQLMQSLGGVRRAVGPARRRRKRSTVSRLASAAGPRKRRRRASRGRLVKGSAAAKAYMAKIRRRRRR